MMNIFEHNERHGNTNIKVHEWIRQLTGWTRGMGHKWVYVYIA